MLNSDVATSVLIATHAVDYGAALARFLEHDDLQIERCHDSAGVLRLTSLRDFDVIVLDLALGKDSGIDLISFVLEKNTSTRVILLFDMQHLDRALDGIRQGAFFYLPDTCPPSDVTLVVGKALQSQQAEAVADAYEQNVFEELVGHTPAMQRVVDLIRKVAPTDSTVLLLGESGTGKEVLANTIHRLSRRRDKPFVAINCAALPEGLLESELFGHVKGAFTGADRDNPGLFEEADGGTLLLDEIGDMSPITQAKLLRVLQNGDIRRVGSTTTTRVDVRVIAATNRDLLDAVSKNTFREDLYFRLNVIQIRIPPLRERMEALPTLIAHFLRRHNTKFGKQIVGIDDRAMSRLQHYAFPGNVRELESVMAHAVIMASGNRIQPDDLPEQVLEGGPTHAAIGWQRDDSVRSLAEAEEDCIRNAMEKLDGNQTLVAKKLGISRSTLWRKLKEYDIPKGNEDDAA